MCDACCCFFLGLYGGCVFVFGGFFGTVDVCVVAYAYWAAFWSRTVQYTTRKDETGYTPSNPTAWPWTSLEGLVDGIYTTQGDVWSYGVVLVELCNLVSAC